MFRLLAQRVPPPNLPKYGYLLDEDGDAVGVILLICSEICDQNATTLRCNLSSWYVEPPYRPYASVLVSRALRHKEATYLNVSPAPPTWPIIEEQGFLRYCDGVFITYPALSGLFDRPKVKVFDGTSGRRGI